MHYDWLSLVPPLLAIILAIATRQVYLSLFIGIWSGWIILSDGSFFGGLAASIQACIDVFKDAGNTRVIIFCALIGALLTLMQRNGGVSGFITWITNKNLVQSRRGASVLAWILGMVIFIESSITCLISGAVSRPIFERLKISREKLAYILDSTSAPVCILIPLNAWGAYVIGLIEREDIENALSIFVSSITVNFYAIFAVLIVGFVVISGIDIGPMRKAERRAREEGKTIRDGAVPTVSEEITSIEPKDESPQRPLNMLIPIIVMILMMPAGLYITGEGDITAGTGTTAVLWSVLAAITTAGVLSVGQRILHVREVMDLSLKGIGGLVPLAILMMLAFAIGDTSRELGTGIYVAGIADEFLQPELVAPVVFLAAAVIAFSTGTSWGTFAIMIPIALPTALLMDIHAPLALAAVLSGGVFGDHVSPISDTTLVSSMAAASDHIDHVTTQLPYASIAAGIATLLFYMFGILMH